MMNEQMDYLDEIDRLELSLLQEIWQLESSLLELIRSVQDIQLELQRLKSLPACAGTSERDEPH